MKILKKITSIIIAVMLIASPAAAEAPKQTVPEGYSVVSVILNYISRYYQYDVSGNDILDSVIKQYLTDHPEAFEDIVNSIMDLLDEHSVYYTADEFNAFTENIEAEFAGIGAYLTKYDGKITITSVMEDSPAQRAGLMTNDAIIAVNGENVVGMDMDYVLTLVRGLSGSEVTLKIEREGVSPFDVVITRAVLHEVTVSGAIINDNIGYIQIVGFSTETADEFKKELERLEGLGADRYIVDLRNNGGGVTNAATECVAQFLPKGAPIFIEDSKAYGKALISSSIDGKYKNLAVLVNEYTASASEIFATAIQSNDAGVIVGTKTYGKGTVQTTAGLGTYGGIKLTIAEFYSPEEKPINKVGIMPDVYVTNITRTVEEDDLYPLLFNKKFKSGDTDEQIYALKHRLAILKYYGGDLDNYFDAALVEAVKKFQAENGLFSYGELDFTTQTTINNLVKSAEITVDTQLDTAIEEVSKF